MRRQEKLQLLSHGREQKNGSTLFTTLGKKNYNCEETPDDVLTKNLCEERLKGKNKRRQSIRFAIWFQKAGLHQMAPIGFFFKGRDKVMAEEMGFFFLHKAYEVVSSTGQV